MPRGSRHRSFETLRCPFQGCPKAFRSQAGRTNHVRSVHPRADRHRQVIQPDIEVRASPTPSRSSPRLPNIDPFPEDSSEPAEHHPPPAVPQRKTYHPFLNGKFFFSFFCVLITEFCISLGRPCDENGNYLPLGTPPPPRPTAAPGDWNPFEDEVQFKVADFLYRQEEMSQGNINHLLELWALSLMKHGSVGPFDSYKDIYDRIDAIEEGNSCLNSQASDPVTELNLTQGMLHGNVSRRRSMKKLTTQRRIGKNRNTRFGTVIQRWWLEICSRTRTSIMSLTQRHMLSSIKMVHVDARISCQVIFHGANAYIFIYLISISHVIKMNVCLRILFMKKTQPKTKVACLFLSSSAATKPQSWSVLAISNTIRYTSQLALCGTQ